jgi:hypothetical protein
MTPSPSVTALAQHLCQQPLRPCVPVEDINRAVKSFVGICIHLKNMSATTKKAIAVIAGIGNGTGK